MNPITKRLRSRAENGDGPSEAAPVVTSGIARPNSKTKDLVKQLKPGDIAVIGHRNIDRSTLR